MTILLYILLGVVIGVILLVGIIWFVIRRFIRGIGKALAQLGGLGMLPPPRRITLAGAKDGEWRKAGALTRRLAALKELGFEEAGAFDIEEMMLQRVVGLVHRDTCSLAAVYPVKDSVRMDLVSAYSDGSSFTASDARDGVYPRPERHPCVRMPGRTAKEFFEEFLAARPDSVLKEVNPETFKQRFEQLHAEQMDWLIERGGYTFEELRAANPMDPQDETAGATLRELHDQCVTGCLKYWWEQHPEPPRNFTEVEDDLVVIHDGLTREQLAERYNNALDLDADENDDAAEGVDFREDVGAREAFALWNDARGGRLQRTWEKPSPSGADFYLPSQDGEPARG